MVEPIAQSNPTQSGFVRIKPGEGGTLAKISSWGAVHVFLSPETTAAELAAQLYLLGCEELDETEIEIIASQNGDDILDPEELEALDNYLEITLKKDRETVLAAVSEHGGALYYADDSLKKDKEIVLAAVRRDGLALEYADKSLKTDAEIVLAAHRQNAEAFQYADRSLKKDKTIVLAAISRHSQTLIYADASLQNDPSFLERVFMANFNSYYYMPEALMGKFTNRYYHIVNSLKALNIDFPERFGAIANVREIINNRKNLDKYDPRPLAVVIYPKDDSSGSFAHNNQIENLVVKGYRVVYFESARDRDVYAQLKDATHNQKAELFVLGGHGTKTHIAMGEIDPAKSEFDNDDRYIDLSDENEMFKMELSNCLTNGAIVILDSCSTGKIGEKGNNVANLMKRVFPQAKIFAPTAPASPDQYIYDDHGIVIGVKYDIGEAKTYSIK